MKLANQDFSHNLKPSKCKDCGEKILWSRVYMSDKPIPLNPEPRNIGLYGTEYVLDMTTQAHQISRELCIFTCHLETCTGQQEEEKSGLREKLIASGAQG